MNDSSPSHQTSVSDLPPRRPTDFSRRVVPILGLPFDVVTLTQALEQTSRAVRQGEKLFLSTSNLNFLALSQKDECFRLSVFESDLNIADGTSIILLAKMLGTPLPHRIAGSTLFEELSKTLQKDLRVYLFGGNEGVAEEAAKQIAANSSGADVVGWQFPGFFAVAPSRDPAAVSKIYESNPNFVLVALGAQKGQAWIRHNFDRLPPGVVSHLGAVIDFIAKRIRRAPLWVQRMGLEWAWRIKEQPSLWRRYWNDSKLITTILVASLAAKWKRELIKFFRSKRPPIGTVDASASQVTIYIDGDWQSESMPGFTDLLNHSTDQVLPVTLKISPKAYLCPEAIGAIMLLAGHQSKNKEAFYIETLSPQLSEEIAEQGLSTWLCNKAPGLAQPTMHKEARQ